MSDEPQRDDQEDSPTWGGKLGVPGDRELRYRVVEVFYIGPGNGEVTSGDIRQYKTPEGAQAGLARWTKAGKSAVMQPGVLRWLPGDEDPRAALGMPGGDNPRSEEQEDAPTWGGKPGVPGDRELRYRAVEALHIDPGSGRVTSGIIREFKTPEGAQDCQGRWVAAGKAVVTQAGVLRWLPAGEDPQAALGMTVDGE